MTDLLESPPPADPARPAGEPGAATSGAVNPESREPAEASPVDGEVPVIGIRLLGPVEVIVDGETVALPVRQTRAALAALALRHPRPCSADELAELLWPEERPERWQASLYAHVSRLRKVVTPEVLRRVPAGYHLAVEPDAIDTSVVADELAAARSARDRGDLADAEEALDRALGCWRGPALRELEDFAFAESAARSLERQRLAALDARVVMLVELGRCDEATEVARTRVELDPLDEAGWVRWTETLVGAGHWHEARRVAAEAAATLRAELGVEPGPELAELQGRVEAEIERAGVAGATVPEDVAMPANPPDPPDPPVVDLRGWLDALDPVDHLVLSLLAIAGERSDPVVVGRAGEVGTAELLAVVRRARAAGALEEHDRSIVLTAQAASVITEGLGAGERALLCRRLVDASEAASGQRVVDGAARARWALGAVPAGLPVAEAVAAGAEAIVATVRRGDLADASELAALLEVSVGGAA